MSTPDNPPWGVLQAFFTWGTSVALLLTVPVLALIPYVIYKVLVFGSAESLRTDNNVVFISILAVLPAHILSFLVVWLVVTSKGQRPFWQTLGWSWPKGFGPWKSIGLAVALLVVGWLITEAFGGSETQLDQIIKSSYKARFATAFLAAVTGPVVEELIYRGLLYSALQRAIGMLWAVVLVSFLFAGVHVFQYYNNFAVIGVIAVLSVSLTLVRARTGVLLPSVVMHVVFNGIQALVLVLQPFIGKHASEQKAAAGFLVESLLRLLR